MINNRSGFLAAFTAMLLSTTALADTSSLSTATSGMGVLENDYVKAGVNGTTGTFGSGNNTSPGLLFDSTGTGTFNTSYDYLTPGSPFDGFSVKIDGTNYTNNNSGNQAQITNCDCHMGETMFDGTNYLIWGGEWSHGGSTWEIEHTYSLGATSQYIDITTSITAGSSASNSTVYFGRFIDPDARAADGDSSATDNVLGYSGIPDSNVAFSEATTSRYALGLYSTNSNVDAGITGWTTEADSYTDSKYTDSDGNTVNYGTGDDTIGLTWVWTGVEAGDILTADYSYIFGPSAFEAADEAIDGGAGGGTAGETPESWGAVEDVGSATEAAESSSGPTVIGAATSSLTRHTVTESDGVQTVGRVKTTSVWDVYSDGTTGTASATTETLPSFAGRIDQNETMEELNYAFNRNNLTNPFKKGGIETSLGTLYLDVGYSKVNFAADYDANIKNVGGLLEIPLNSDLTVGINLNKMGSEITGVNSSSEFSKVYGGIGVTYTYGKLISTTDFGIAKTEYRTQREIPEFYDGVINGSEAEGKDFWGKQRVYYKASDNIIPFIGAGVGKYKRDAVEEAGFFLTKRDIPALSETEKYAEAGVRAEFDISDFTLTGQASYSTDKYLVASAGVAYNITENSSVGVTFNKLSHEDTDIKSLGAELNIKF